MSQTLSYDYTYLSNLFSDVKGITIEHYLISSKLQKVKQLIIEGELNMTEISYKMNYSSIAHLSKQFKKMTGLTLPSIRQRKENYRLLSNNQCLNDLVKWLHSRL